MERKKNVAENAVQKSKYLKNDDATDKPLVV